MATVSKIYNCKKWDDIRKAVIKRDKGICYFCHKPILNHAQVHHLQEVNELNYMNENIVYNLDNLVCVHRECHNAHHKRFCKRSIVDENLNVNYKERG